MITPCDAKDCLHYNDCPRNRAMPKICFAYVKDFEIDYVDAIEKMFKDNKFCGFHKMFRQIDVCKDPKVDVAIHQIISSDVYLPNNSDNISDGRHAKSLVYWIEEYASKKVIDGFKKGIKLFVYGEE